MEKIKKLKVFFQFMGKNQHFWLFMCYEFFVMCYELFLMCYECAPYPKPSHNDGPGAYTDKPKGKVTLVVK